MSPELRLLIDKIKLRISEKSFIHNEWYLKYHLQVVLNLSREFSELEGIDFNENIELLVWMHDYGKIFLCDKEYIKYEKFITSCGFKEYIAERVTQQIIEIDRKDNLHKSNIVVQIVSSADGISHIITPFYMFYWRENHIKNIDDILKENRRKLKVDWEKKVVLQYAKTKYSMYYNSLQEQFSEKYKY